MSLYGFNARKVWGGFIGGSNWLARIDMLKENAINVQQEK